MPQKHYRWARPTIVGFLFAVGTLSLNSAVAASPPSYEQMYEMIKGLQAQVTTMQTRVTTLEKQNEAYRAQLASVRTNSNTGSRPQPAVYYPGLMGDPILLAGAPGGPSNGATNGSRNHESVAPVAKDPGWTGLYLGSSFGYGRTNAMSSMHQDWMATGSSRSVDPGGPYYVYTYTDTATVAGESDWESGDVAAVDLLLGFNKQVSPKLVAGVQLEGTLAHGDFDTVLPVTETDIYKSKSGQENDAQYSTNGTSTYSEYPLNDVFTLNWMASLLGRVGWLATPKTLVYGLAGWTHGHFDRGDHVGFEYQRPGWGSFGLDGLSLGAGVERKLGRNWTLRAEYRYTDFEDYEAFSSITGTSSGSSINGPDGRPDLSSTVTGSGTYTNQVSSKFDGDMQMFRIALTRYFGLND